MSSSFIGRPNHSDDVEVLYTMTAPVAELNTARLGVNHPWYQLDKIRTTSNSLIFEARQHISVELRTEGNDITIECSCQAYRPGHYCGDCFWALDQVVRASADQSQPNIPCNVRSDGITITAVTSGGYIRPHSIAGLIGKAAMKKAIERHTYAKVNFKVVVDRVGEQARQTLLWLSEQELLASFAVHENQILTVGGGRLRTATTTHRDLQKYAEELLHAYKAYILPIRYTNDVDEEYRAATGIAMKTYLWMMKSVLLHMSTPTAVGLRFVAASALYHGEGHENRDYFWDTVHCFFKYVMQSGLRFSPEHVDELRVLKSFLGSTTRTSREGEFEDSSVYQKIDEWLSWQH